MVHATWNSFEAGYEGIALCEKALVETVRNGFSTAPKLV